MRFQGLITILSAFYGFVETASAASTFSFTQCANDATSVFLSAPNSSFLVASDGTFTSNLTKAWGIRYESCNNLCGPPGGWEAFDWIFFSTSVSAWVLPWLALTAQLPYETRSSFNNLLSLLLAVGSPMLITYSLCLTILNSRWINKYFRSLRDNNEELRGKQVKALKAARTFLRESQHVPIKVQQSRAEFAQLVVLPQNRTWWESLRKEVIKSKREWNVAWVTVTEVITIVDFFTSAVDNNTIRIGVAVNSLWIWMIPVALGWVWVGTQNSASTIREALMSVEASIGFPPRKVTGQMIGFQDNSGEDTPISRQMDLEAGYGEICPTTIDRNKVDSDCQETIEMADLNGAIETGKSLLTKATSVKIPVRRMILGCSIAGYALEPGPIFNYARVWNHLRTAEYVGNAFCILNCNLKARRSVQGRTWVEDPHRWKDNLVGWCAETTSANGNYPNTSAADEITLTGTSLDEESPHEITPAEMEGYVFSRFNIETGNTPGITQNFIVATAVAVILQWGTTGSAILIAYRTPVIGLGCESGGYLLYGLMATAAWSCLVGSAYLSHKYSASAIEYDLSLSLMNVIIQPSNQSRPSSLDKPNLLRSSYQTTDLRSTILALLIVVTRVIGKTLACCNAFWLVTISLLQFTNVYNNCWCSANVLQYGTVNGWVLLWATDDQIVEAARNDWISSVIMSGLALLFAGLFFIFMPGEEIFDRPTQ